MHYVVEKINKNSLRDIIQEANRIISQIPHASDILIREEIFSNPGTFLFLCHEVGYFFVLIQGDHAEVFVSFWGKTIHDVVKNLIWEEVDSFCSKISATLNRLKIDVRNEFWGRYRNILQFDDFIPPKGYIFNEIYIPYFIERNQDQSGTFNRNSLIVITSERHRMFFHPEVGYYYSKPIDSTRIELSFIGMNESDAFSWIRHNILISKSSGTLFDYFFKR